jgi:hypothetical protein
MRVQKMVGSVHIRKYTKSKWRVEIEKRRIVSLQ